MPGVDIRIDGAEELVRRLDRLDVRAKALLAGALRKASAVIVEAARALVPVRTGALRASLGFYIKEARRGGKYAVIGARRGFQSRAFKQAQAAGFKIEPANYAHLVERGTKPHLVGAQDGGFAGGVERNRHGQLVPRRVRIGGRQHPGAKAQPFLFPAVAAAGPNAIAILKAELEHAISEAERLY